MDGHGRRVLVVDDELHLRIFMSAVFETSGFSVRTARDGTQGLALARELRPDLITLDLMMPGEGGVRMYRALKADPELRTVPVVVVSAVSGRTFRHSLNTVSAGLQSPLPPPEAYVEKPPTAPTLLEAAAGVLDRPASPDAPAGEAAPDPRTPTSARPGRETQNVSKRGNTMAKKIMIVDDDPHIVDYLKALFEDNGYATCTAPDGEKALSVMEAERPDLVTLDLEMPNEWGPRFYRKFSQHQDLKDTPVIVISGLSGIHLAIRKAVATIQKPFDPEHVLKIVKQTIG